MPRKKKAAAVEALPPAASGPQYAPDTERLFGEWKKLLVSGKEGPDFRKRARLVYEAVLGREGVQALIESGFQQAMNLWESQ